MTGAVEIRPGISAVLQGSTGSSAPAAKGVGELADEAFEGLQRTLGGATDEVVKKKNLRTGLKALVKDGFGYVLKAIFSPDSKVNHIRGMKLAKLAKQLGAFGFLGMGGLAFVGAAWDEYKYGLNPWGDKLNMAAAGGLGVPALLYGAKAAKSLTGKNIPLAWVASRFPAAVAAGPIAIGAISIMWDILTGKNSLHYGKNKRAGADLSTSGVGNMSHSHRLLNGAEKLNGDDVQMYQEINPEHSIKAIQELMRTTQNVGLLA